MANQHHTSLELIDSFGESVDGLDVEMVGGFVE